MITIRPLTTNQIVLWNDLFTAYDEFKAVWIKIDKTQTIECSFSTITEYEKWTNFIIQDVDILNQDLPLGLISLNRFPGEWTFELYSKTTSATSWTLVYKDLARVLNNQIVYQNI